MSVAVIAATYSCAKPLLRLLGADDRIVEYGLNYAKILFATIGFSSISTVLASILRGSGDTRTLMKIIIVSNLLAVMFGFMLIYGHFSLPEMGFAGLRGAVYIACGHSGVRQNLRGAWHGGVGRQPACHQCAWLVVYAGLRLCDCCIDAGRSGAGRRKAGAGGQLCDADSTIVE